MELVLVRHAETVWNAEGRWQGQTDVPLSDHGRTEVDKVAERFRGERFDRVVSSDLVRAIDTAKGITDALVASPEIERDAGLREMNLGRWCGLLHEEVEARFPGELAALQLGTFAEGVHRRIGHDGETLIELAARVHASLDRVIASARETDRILVVTHGGVIRTVLMSMLRLDGLKRPLVGARNTAITTLQVASGARTVRTYNDARHIGPDPHAHATHEAIVGPSARDEVIALLGLATDAPLSIPNETATSVVSRAKRQLVTFGVPG